MSAGPQAHVNLSTIEANLALVRSHIAAGVKIMAAVKADAYGHGLVPVTQRLASAGVEWFAVATPEEALALRAAGVGGGVLLLSPVIESATITLLADADVSLTLTDDDCLARYANADLPRHLKLHLKIDTGMGRLGCPASEAPRLAQAVARTAGGPTPGARLELEGVFTHFADSDNNDHDYTLRQLAAFHEALNGLERLGLTPPLRHAANSAAILAHREAQFDMVRPGIVLYGYHPAPGLIHLEPRLRPALTLSAPVTFVKRVNAGTQVSYGGSWRAPQSTMVATARIGYADGYPRALSGQAHLSFQGQDREVLGRVCMDQLMFDLGPEGHATPGERCILWGEGGPDGEELAQRCGTVSYELLTGLGSRVERVYVD